MSLSQLSDQEFSSKFTFTHNRYDELTKKKLQGSLSDSEEVEFNLMELAVQYYNIELKRRANQILQFANVVNESVAIELITERLKIEREFAEILILQNRKNESVRTGK